MTTIKVNGKDYIIKFGYNSFCDSDLLDRTTEVLGILQADQGEKDSEFTRKLFVVTRELLFEGFKKKNPIGSLEEVGDLLDDYMDEGTEEETHGLIDVFSMIAQELLTEGFFGDILKKSEKAIQSKQNVTKIKKK